MISRTNDLVALALEAFKQAQRIYEACPSDDAEARELANEETRRTFRLWLAMQIAEHQGDGKRIEILWEQKHD